MVVKEIEIFGNFWYPKVGEEICGARRMALCEQAMAKIKLKSREVWAIQIDVTDECRILRHPLAIGCSTSSTWLPFDFRWVYF